MWTESVAYELNRVSPSMEQTRALLSRRFHEDVDLGQRFDRAGLRSVCLCREAIADAMVTIG